MSSIDEKNSLNKFLNQARLPISDGKTTQYELAFHCISTVLDSLDALVYVSDFATHELLFFNRYGREIWGDPNDKLCFNVLQSGQDKQCDFCTNDKLLDEHGEPTGVYVWEFQNTVNNRWYQCRDQAIRWIDGRLVRMEIATDITDRKNAEDELRCAKELAEKRAATDELTGICNRRSFFKLGESAFQHARLHNEPITAVMMDVDHFKKINDEFGHAAGDQVLKQFSESLQESIRNVDIAGRVGGEEFAVILIGATPEIAVQICERIRLAAAAIEVKAQSQAIKITLSLGLASLNKNTQSLESLINQADKALYCAKENGRNQLSVFGSEITGLRPHIEAR